MKHFLRILENIEDIFYQYYSTSSFHISKQLIVPIHRQTISNDSTCSSAEDLISTTS